MDQLVKQLIDTGILLAVIVILSILLKYFILWMLKKHTNKRRRTMTNLLVNITRYVLLFLGVFIGLQIWGIDTAALLAGASFFGLAFGLGAQKFIGDMINGFFIIFENQYNVDDDVELNGNLMGTVIDIGLKTTLLRSFDGKMHAIANGDITSITNFSKFPALAIVKIKVAYKNRIQDVEKVVKQFIDQYKGERKEIIGTPQYTGVDGSDAEGYEVRVIAQTKPFEHFGTERWIRGELIKWFQNANIEQPILLIDNYKYEYELKR